MCRSCHLGLLLETRGDLIPTARDAFLVVDSGLLIQAVSRRAENLLEITEALSVNQPLKNVLAPADAESLVHPA